MAKYLNLYKKKSLSSSKAYGCGFAHWLCENDYMVSIEDEGRLYHFPVFDEVYLQGYTADEFLAECIRNEIFIVRPIDVKARLTEWICNEGSVNAEMFIPCVCHVVGLLVKYGLWEDEYARYIDIEKIKEEWNEEEEELLR